MSFLAKTWNNGKHHLTGAGYGLKISLENRDRFFNRNWQTVILHLQGYHRPIEVNVAKASFWNRTCRELIKKDIGIWLYQNDKAPWTSGQPHEVKIKLIGDREFNVELIS